MKPRPSELVGIFLLGCSTLLLELTLTKIFEFSLWSNYAFLIISTAMFGLGFSGIVLTRWPRLLAIRDSVFLVTTGFLCAVCMFVAFCAVNYVPVHLPDAPNGWMAEILASTVVFLGMATPFFFFGLIMGYVMHHRGKLANVYYFADLVGCGLASVALVLLIPIYFPEGIVAICIVLSLAATCTFAVSLFPARGGKIGAIVTGIVVVILGFTVLAPRMNTLFPLNVHVAKRTYAQDVENGLIEKTGWSALSRVDVAPMGEHMKRVWIAGGVNESSIHHFGGDFEKIRAERPKVLKKAAEILDYKCLPHLSKSNHTVCVIGTSGGSDALYTLYCGARHVTGIEMDPTIARVVTEDYREFAGNLFVDGKYSELVVDEGRSYLRRAGRQFDVIQQINNFTPIAFQNGALNLSETYLLTVESFQEFFNALTDEGILSISRYGSVKLLSLAVEMFREMGIPPEEYSKHLVVCEGPVWIINTFMMKKTPFTQDEVDDLFSFFDAGAHGRRILYAPYSEERLPGTTSNIYYQIATSENPEDYWRMGCFDFGPTTDNKPFFNRLKMLGRRDTSDVRKSALFPGEVRAVESRSKLGRIVPKGDIPPLLVLLEALFLSTLFFGLPVMTKAALRKDLRAERRRLGYFAGLGLAFIFVEICLIQRFVLFLGAPVYSISVVFGSLLVFAGLGSLASGILKPTRKSVIGTLLTVAALILALQMIIPLITAHTLGLSFTGRIVVTILLTGIPGFFMGMPMPLGIRYLSENNSRIVPWAWGINCYFTVVGSTLTVLLAITLGFASVLVTAAAVYAIAPFFLVRQRT